MIRETLGEVHSPEWVGLKITDRNHELNILRKIIPWEKNRQTSDTVLR
jgi:hypothetical protein